MLSCATYQTIILSELAPRSLLSWQGPPSLPEQRPTFLLANSVSALAAAAQSACLLGFRSIHDPGQSLACGVRANQQCCSSSSATHATLTCSMGCRAELHPVGRGMGGVDRAWTPPLCYVDFLSVAPAPRHQVLQARRFLISRASSLSDQLSYPFSFVDPSPKWR